MWMEFRRRNAAPVAGADYVGRAEEDLPVLFSRLAADYRVQPEYLTDGPGSLHRTRVVRFSDAQPPAVLRLSQRGWDGAALVRAFRPFTPTTSLVMPVRLPGLTCLRKTLYVRHLGLRDFRSWSSPT